MTDEERVLTPVEWAELGVQQYGEELNRREGPYDDWDLPEAPKVCDLNADTDCEACQ